VTTNNSEKVEVEWQEKQAEVARRYGVDPDEVKNEVPVRDAIMAEVVDALRDSGVVRRSDLSHGSTVTQSNVLRSMCLLGLIEQGDGVKYVAGSLAFVK
jgi:hypothetical protein